MFICHMWQVANGIYNAGIKYILPMIIDIPITNYKLKFFKINFFGCFAIPHVAVGTIT
jgi:hypothetical protein